ncbi:oligosaccharide flippase family protein [Accumulibacter sp.]|uniref:oligosaccharide flippase family protein n=1 Tax=Accumulibacter sp. TaxID=2053492 RepID=UPI0028C44FCB|nr:oligosaccharide flippase family protein [Accumulibacter sp.]
MMVSLFETIRDSLSKHKLTRDIAWSMGSFFVLAISGIVINVAVTALRDAAALGVFNLAYAVYIVISQLAIWGIHYSVLRHAAFFKENPVERGTMLFTAAAMALVSGVLAAALTVLAEPLFAAIFESSQTAAAVRYSALGLLLFPLNKVLLAYLNGLQEMRVFSILQGFRYLMVMLTVTAIAASSLPIELATLAFFVAEVGTALGAVVWFIKCRPTESMTFSAVWVRKHFAFGTKGLAGGMFAEVNSRIDVLLIGFFLNDRATGIYSFAAMLVDGLYQVLAMIRINFNPVLVGAVRDGNWEQARRLRIQSRRFVQPVVLVLSMLLVIAYYVLAAWMVPGKGLLEGLPSLLILLAGLNLISVLVPFDNLMVVSGHPGYQAAQQMTAVGANIIMAAVLLPLIGIEGAALGTALSYLCGILMLVIFSSRLLGWRLLSNTVPVGR